MSSWVKVQQTKVEVLLGASSQDIRQTVAVEPSNWSTQEKEPVERIGCLHINTSCVNASPGCVALNSLD